MERIASFSVDHTKLEKGMYVSRVDGDVITYDLRMCTPNAGSYLENGALHTFEHLFATFARNGSFSDAVVYIGPMGCRTGFYLLTRDSLSKADAIRLMQESCAYIASYEGEIPGSSEPECGNYRDHDLAGAKKIAADYASVLQNWSPENLAYNT